MNSITQLPQTHDGNTAIIVFLDRLSKMTVLAPAKTQVVAKKLATIFMDKVCSSFGILESTVSDKDTRFTSLFFKEICSRWSIKQNVSTAFHPQTDGQRERESLESLKRC